LNIQYRKLVKGRKWDVMHPRANGLIRCHKRNDPEGTKIAKLCRKRLLEFLSKKSLEPRLVSIIESESLQHLIPKLREAGKNGTVAFDCYEIIVQRALNVVLQFALGIDLGDKPKKLHDLTDVVNKGNESVNKLDTYKLIFMLIPYRLREFIPLRFWPDWCRTNNIVYDEILDMIDEHNEAWQPGDEILTFISALEQDRHANKITESDVIHNMQALFLAGADTTAISICNVIVNLARFPQVQKRLYEELQMRNFQCENMTDCPYLLAVLWESFRYTNSIYRTLIHSVTEPTEVLGYQFEKDDLIATGIMGISMSEKYFKDPYVFHPERFLKDGVFHKDENLLPYNCGKRSCPGMILANIEIFHFTKNILNAYVIEMDPEAPLENAPTKESWDAYWSHGNHDLPLHQFIVPRDSRIRFVPRK